LVDFSLKFDYFLAIYPSWVYLLLFVLELSGAPGMRKEKESRQAPKPG
jgi:hypothetical protein